MTQEMLPEGLGTLLRRLIAALDGGVEQSYDAAGFAFRARYYPVVLHLLGSGGATVGALAAAQGVSQPAVSQTLREMEREGLVALAPGADRRSRIVTLTPAAHVTAARLAPTWAAIAAAAGQLQREAGPLAEIARKALAALEARPFAARIAAEMQP